MVTPVRVWTEETTKSWKEKANLKYSRETAPLNQMKSFAELSKQNFKFREIMNFS